MVGHIRQKGKNWYIVVDVYENNKRKRKWFSGYARRKDAEKDLPNILSKVQSNFVDPKNMTIKDLTEKWLCKISQVQYSYKTNRENEYKINKYIIPTIGHIKLYKLKNSDIQSLIDNLADVNKLAYKTIKNIKQILGSIMNYAVKSGYITVNPVEKTIIPVKNEKKDMEVWNEFEVKKFLNLLKENEPLKIYLAFSIAFLTGVRRGELCALTWKKINHFTQTITIDKSMQIDGSIKSPKTKNGIRSITLNRSLFSILVDFERFQKECEEVQRDNFAQNDFILCHENGKPFLPDYLTKVFTKLIKKYDMKHIRFHDIRHTFATLMLLNHVQPKVVQEILGHSSIVVTLDVYSHVIPSMQTDAINKLNNLI